MKASLQINQQMYYADVSKPMDISITTNQNSSPIAWYAPRMKIEPVISDRFVGSVERGGVVNFRNLFLNPHGNCTHTECVGHISNEVYSVHSALEHFHFSAELITVYPTILKNDVSQWMKKGDYVITLDQLSKLVKGGITALVIRTMPNSESKKTKNYNQTNWPYLTKEAATFIREMGIYHLLIDLPSIDREEDDGLLVAHRAFWDYPNQIDLKRTITELIFVPDYIKDGFYLLNLSPANINNDASPSRPVLYKLSK